MSGNIKPMNFVSLFLGHLNFFRMNELFQGFIDERPTLRRLGSLIRQTRTNSKMFQEFGVHLQIDNTKSIVVLQGNGRALRR